MNTSFIVISVIIILLAIDLRIKLDVSFDILKNLGHIEVKLFGITVFSSAITVAGDYFKFTNNRKKVLSIKIDLTDKNIKFVQDIMAYFKKKIFFIKFTDDVFISFQDPFLVTMVTGTLRSVSGYIDTLVKSKTPDTEIKSSVYTGFLENTLYFELYTHLLVSLFDLLWSFIKAIYRRSIAVYEK